MVKMSLYFTRLSTIPIQSLSSKSLSFIFISTQQSPKTYIKRSRWRDHALSRSSGCVRVPRSSRFHAASTLSPPPPLFRRRGIRGFHAVAGFVGAARAAYAGRPTAEEAPRFLPHVVGVVKPLCSLTNDHHGHDAEHQQERQHAQHDDDRRRRLGKGGGKVRGLKFGCLCVGA